ncbi:ATPase AAA-2 domain protein [Thiorhodococcus drewsii AZ1]|uniref:ATPase AAA-2 domain protein n=1 Tax=Thiorhodococcus drewsii AZ1 TaxID=765913 RepID=G2DYP4_9GAMM|nr:AAA family ATPase [Thiorhodococcus drewsii]EGV32671.1 ATPase AAA-2 domain protein [Thiorhodococcus drewsii AZ1]
MSNTMQRLDEELGENITLAAQVASCVVLAGRRQFDRFLLSNPGGGSRVLTLERLCHEQTAASATWTYDPARRSVALARASAELHQESALPTRAGRDQTLGATEVLESFASLTAPDQGARFAMLVDAGLLLEDAATPRDGDFRLLQAIERFARLTDRQRTLFLRVDRPTALPSAVLASPQVRTVHIPAASRDVRNLYALKRSRPLADRCAVSPEAVARLLSDATEDWTLDQLDALVQTAERQGCARMHDIEELARAVRIGTTHSPWAGERIHHAVAHAREDLTQRVLGQPKAVETVVSALRKAVIGLSAAHQSEGSQAPRAVFFFAGPTGTGKTELAKAISEIVFGQEQLLRFDCGELRQEHAVARLIGAPPGYVGYDRGGELTEGIRAKPNSVVLFDEIEKAHPRLLDTLLGVLDDGRLTSGQGETSYFGQAVLIFTSNLGLYEEIGDGNGGSSRRACFDYETPFDTIEHGVREAIQRTFIAELGRPELLGRLGGAESIVVFDYLRDLERVCRKFVANIAKSCERLRDVELEVDAELITQVVRATRSRPEALILGGRGLRPELDRCLTNPLADYLFEHPHTQGSVRVSLVAGKPVFSVGDAASHQAKSKHD